MNKTLIDTMLLGTWGGSIGIGDDGEAGGDWECGLVMERGRGGRGGGDEGIRFVTQ